MPSPQSRVMVCRDPVSYTHLVILPDGLIEFFFKLYFVLNAVRALPQLFVQQLPEHYAFLCVLLIANIAPVSYTHLEQHKEVRVFKDVLNLRACQKILHVLR